MKRINILLSSYNGEKYIGEQIDSVMNQSDVNTILTIRDDGSTDGTLAVIQEKIVKYPERIRLIKGENIGYRRSFLSLLEKAERCEYYGFCDQDDYWQTEKCICGIKKIEESKSSMVLYATGVTLVDEMLNIIGKTDSWNMPLTIESYFTRQRLAGCTYIFDEKLRSIAARFCDMDYPNEQMPDHDFVVGSCAFACGSVILDSKSGILHRRHRKSVTSGGLGILSRIKVEYGLVFRRKHVQSTMAKELIKRCEGELTVKANAFLPEAATCNNSVFSRIKMIRNKKMTTNMWYCDLETRIKIMLGNY